MTGWKGDRDHRVNWKIRTKRLDIALVNEFPLLVFPHWLTWRMFLKKANGSERGKRQLSETVRRESFLGALSPQLSTITQINLETSTTHSIDFRLRPSPLSLLWLSWASTRLQMYSKKHTELTWKKWKPSLHSFPLGSAPQRVVWDSC